MGGDGGCDGVGRSSDKLHCILCGDVFQYYFQLWKCFDDGNKMAIDKYLFPVEYVDIVVGYLAVYQQGYSVFFHGCQSGVEAF